MLEPNRTSDAAAVPGDPFPGAVPVPDAAISRALYGTLAGDAAFDAWRLTVSVATTAPVEMLVPAAAANEIFRPSFALVGEGLATTGPSPAFIRERLAAAGGSGAATGSNPGVITVPDPGQTPRPTFYEPFSFTRYFEGGSTTATLLPGRTYYLIAYDPAGGRGEYTFGVARAEKWRLTDAAAAIVAVLRIKLGLFGQQTFHALATAVMVLIVAAVSALVVILVLRRRRRRALPPPSQGSRI